MTKISRLLAGLASVVAVLLLSLGFSTSAQAAPCTSVTEINCPGVGNFVAHVTGQLDNLVDGVSHTLGGIGFLNFENVSFQGFSDPVTFGTAAADANGTVTLNFIVPQNYVGTHTVVLTGETSGRVASATILVSASGVDATSTGSGGGLALTGVEIGGMVVVGLGLLGGGTLLVVSGRRRRQTVHSA